MKAGESVFYSLVKAFYVSCSTSFSPEHSQPPKPFTKQKFGEQGVPGTVQGTGVPPRTRGSLALLRWEQRLMENQNRGSPACLDEVL